MKKLFNLGLLFFALAACRDKSTEEEVVDPVHEEPAVEENVMLNNTEQDNLDEQVNKALDETAADSIKEEKGMADRPAGLEADTTKESVGNSAQPVKSLVESNEGPSTNSVDSTKSMDPIDTTTKKEDQHVHDSQKAKQNVEETVKEIDRVTQEAQKNIEKGAKQFSDGVKKLTKENKEIDKATQEAQKNIEEGAKQFSDGVKKLTEETYEKAKEVINDTGK